jgi:hypothetical protein
MILVTKPDLNHKEKGFASAEWPSDLGSERQRPRKIIHIDMDAFYGSWGSAIIPNSGASLSPWAGRENAVS